MLKISNSIHKSAVAISLITSQLLYADVISSNTAVIVSANNTTVYDINDNVTLTLDGQSGTAGEQSGLITMLGSNSVLTINTANSFNLSGGVAGGVGTIHSSGNNYVLLSNNINVGTLNGITAGLRTTNAGSGITIDANIFLNSSFTIANQDTITGTIDGNAAGNGILNIRGSGGAGTATINGNIGSTNKLNIVSFEDATYTSSYDISANEVNMNSGSFTTGTNGTTITATNGVYLGKSFSTTTLNINHTDTSIVGNIYYYDDSATLTINVNEDFTTGGTITHDQIWGTNDSGILNIASGKTLTANHDVQANVNVTGTFKPSVAMTNMHHLTFTTNGATLDLNDEGHDITYITMAAGKGVDLDGNTITITSDKATSTSPQIAVIDDSANSGNTSISTLDFNDITLAGTFTGGHLEIINDILYIVMADGTTIFVEEFKKLENVHTNTFKASNQTMNLIHNIVEIRQNQINNFNPGKTGENSGDEMMVDQNLWFKPFVGYGNQSNKDGLNGFKLDTYGFGIGYDRTDKNDATLGGAFFYTQGDIGVNNVQDTVDIKSYTALLYGSNKLQNDVDFMYQLVYGIQNNDTKRYVGANDIASADYSGRNYAIDLKLMKDFEYSDDLKISPIAVATYRNFKSESYSETGSTSNFDVQSATSEQKILKVGSMFTNKIDDTSRFITDLRVGYDFMHGKNGVTATLLGDTATSYGIDNGGVVYNLGLSYEKSQSDDTSFDISYNLEGEGSAFQNHVVSAKYVYKF